MTQSQVAVAYSDMLLPQTKKGNPIPGQFPYKDSYGGACVQSGSYTIPLTSIPGIPGSTIYIAAHTDLFSTVVQEKVVASQVGQPVWGPLDAYHGYQDSAWGSSTAAVMPLFATAGVWANITGADWISTAAETEMGEAAWAPDSWRMTKVDITPPAGTYLLGGTVDMIVNSDNAERVWLNSTELGSQGTIEGTCVDGYEWNSLKTYTFTPVAGTNVLGFVWRNFGLGTTCSSQYTQAQDPNGLIYKATISYYSPTNHGETGWAGSLPFEGSNRATYFTYP